MLCKVAVTGGVSCGKSTVCRFLKEFGAYVVSADEIVHQQLSPNTNLGQKVVKLLGSEIVRDHLIDRSLIAEKVFNDPQLLKSLENLLHPAVRDEIEKHYEEQQALGNTKLFVAEIPLLFETGSEKFYDKTITVAANPDLCKKRFLQIKGYSSEELEKRMSRQLPVSEKIKRADFVIYNDGDLSELKHATKNLYNALINSDDR